MKLSTQLYLMEQIGPPSAEKFHPVKNAPHMKPHGGLWTSTYHDGASEWWEWCRGESFGDYGSAWVLKPQDARVAVLNNPDDLDELRDSYRREDEMFANLSLRPETSDLLSRSGYMVDWEKVSVDYDAVWIPNPHPHRMAMETMFFNVCDVESTLWFRWMFDNVKQIDLESPHRECGVWTYHIRDEIAVCRLTLGHEGMHKSGYFESFEWSDSFTRHEKRSAKVE